MGQIGFRDNNVRGTGPNAEGSHADLGYRSPEIHDPALIHVHRASDAAGGPGYSLNPFRLLDVQIFWQKIFEFFWRQRWSCCPAATACQRFEKRPFVYPEPNWEVFCRLLSSFVESPSSPCHHHHHAPTPLEIAFTSGPGSLRGGRWSHRVSVGYACYLGTMGQQ